MASIRPLYYCTTVGGNVNYLVQKREVEVEEEGGGERGGFHKRWMIHVNPC